MKKAWLVPCVFACLSSGLVLAPSATAATVLNLHSSDAGGAGSGSVGDSICYSSGGSILASCAGSPFVTITAYSNTGSGGALATAALAEYSGFGLGVCNTGEIPGCSSPQHEIDDSTHIDFVLFQFSSTVALSSITLNPVCDCADSATYFLSTGSTPTGSTERSDIVGTTIANLTGSPLQFSGPTDSVNQIASTSHRTISLSGNVTSFLIGADTHYSNDFFKIWDLTVTTSTIPNPTPEPATFGLAGGALLALGVFGRKKNR